jgi:hypothetical protein
VVTVGLRIDREELFHRRVVLENQGVPYAQLCELITELKDELSN